MSESAGTSSSSSKMSDDLSSFFAKKSQRAIEKKKKGVVKIDEVGHQLERKAKRQVLFVDQNEPNKLLICRKSAIVKTKRRRNAQSAKRTFCANKQLKTQNGSTITK